MLMLDYNDKGWRYWVASTTCLWLAVTGHHEAYYLALLIGLVQLVHFVIAERSVTSFPVQIRLGYLSFLMLALPEGFEWILWVPAVDTLLRVAFGYCIMARMLMMLPVNRKTKLTLQFVLDAFFTPPMRGNILHGLPANR